MLSNHRASIDHLVSNLYAFYILVHTLPKEPDFNLWFVSSHKFWSMSSDWLINKWIQFRISNIWWLHFMNHYFTHNQKYKTQEKPSFPSFSRQRGYSTKEGLSHYHHSFCWSGLPNKLTSLSREMDVLWNFTVKSKTWEVVEVKW